MQTKNKIIIPLVIITAIYGIGLAGFNFARALPTNQVNVAAYLADSRGKEITNGEYDVRFSIYRADRTTRDGYPSNADAGSRIWQETQKVKIINGIISTYLGLSTPIPATLSFNDGDYYLGIRIGQDSEMVPRKKLSAIPIAINSLFLRGATTGAASGDIPVLGSGGKLDTNTIPDITSVGVVSNGTWEGDTLAAGFGGTGLASYTAGDMLYASAKNKLAALSIGTNGQFLSITGGIPAWATLDLSAPGIITAGTWRGDVIETAYGGTNASTIGDAGSLAYSTGTAYGFSAAGAGGEVLLSGGAGAPVWGTVTGGVIAPDSLDFTEFSNTMTLDDDTTIDTDGYDFDITGTLSVDTLAANSLIISGDATIGMLGLSVSVSSSLIPSDPGLNLGSATNHWSNLYVDNISVGGTDMSGTTSEFFTINTDSEADENMGLRFYRSALNGYASLTWDAGTSQFNLYKRENTATLADLNLASLNLSGDLNLNGNTLYGDDVSGGNLTLMSTSHATKGKILFGTSAYDEANNRLGIGITPS